MSGARRVTGRTMKKTGICPLAIIALSISIIFFPLQAVSAQPIEMKRPAPPHVRPYGDYCPKEHGRYGATRAVESEAEALAILSQYYRDRDVTVAKLEKRRMFFRAEIINFEGSLVDVVIIDRRTGRIRSIY